MSDTPAKTLGQYAVELEAIAQHLMSNRSSLSMNDLSAEKVRLAALRKSVSSQLSGKQQHQFDANMDKVEDILDGLLRQIEFNNHTNDIFTSDIRRLSGFLRAAASFLWSLTAIFFSIHSNS